MMSRGRRTREQIAISSLSDSSPEKTLSVLQPASLQAGRNVEACSSVPVANLIPTEVDCYLSNGSEGREPPVNAYIKEKLKNLSRSGLEQLVDSSYGAISEVLGEQEAPPAVTPQSNR